MYKSYAVVLLLAFCLVGCGKKDHVIQDFSKWKMDGSSLASRLSEKQKSKVSFLQKWLSPIPEESGVRKRLEVFREAIAGAGILAERPVTVSIGYAVAGPDESIALDVLLKSADTALYAAKNGGRNRVMPDPGASPAPG